MLVEYQSALKKLEEKHLALQPLAWPHFLVHYQMFILAFKYRQWDEVLGQIPRMLLAMPGSWLGKAPKGNVGSTRMGIFEQSKD